MIELKYEKKYIKIKLAGVIVDSHKLNAVLSRCFFETQKPVKMNLSKVVYMCRDCVEKVMFWKKRFEEADRSFDIVKMNSYILNLFFFFTGTRRLTGGV